MDEDIKERFDDLNREFIAPQGDMLRRLEQRAIAQRMDQEAADLRALMGQLDRFANDLLTLATDPQVQAAWVAFNRGNERDTLAAKELVHLAKIERLEKQVVALQAQLTTAEQSRTASEKNLKNVVRERDLAVQRLESYLVDTPNAMAQLLDEKPPSKSQASRR